VRRRKYKAMTATAALLRDRPLSNKKHSMGGEEKTPVTRSLREGKAKGEKENADLGISDQTNEIQNGTGSDAQRSYEEHSCWTAPVSETSRSGERSTGFEFTFLFRKSNGKKNLGEGH